MGGTDLVTLSGVPGSPYTRKMVALLRYRRIPYRLIATNATPGGMPAPKVRLLPTFYMPGPDGEIEAVTDSTPIIARLEREYRGRSVTPTDPVTAFLDALIEDYADEWLTKAMFHYRWRYEPDIRRASDILPCYMDMAVPDDVLAMRARAVAERQIGRLHVVGSNDVTTPVIEASYRRFLEIFNAHLRAHRYVLGARPSGADFAIYGQLTQLAQFDPTPMALTLEIAPRVHAWVSLIEDASGVEPDDDGWFEPSALPATVMALLGEIGRVYAPVMLANARALGSGAARVETLVDGQAWVQPPFAYQGKCLRWLRGGHQTLTGAQRARVDEILANTGCDALFP